ncbi:hsp70 nucleotide exchange factor fes1 [Agyrium rufum]|nr:hsp70 nucleotide exchange factor fes1 [Agyrium rufum]
MAPITAPARTIFRGCTRARLSSPSLPCSFATSQHRTKADAVQSASGEYDKTPSYESPFRGTAEKETTRIPSFGKYMSKKGETSNKVFQYFMVGTMGALAAAGAKATVQDFLVNMAASADVLAQAKVEVDLGMIPEGKNVIIKWRGKPVFIRHRTADEIKDAEDTKWETLRDPQPDSDRVKKPEWLIMVGVCTHLGCVPIGESGDFGGWFCPCHGSHYDVSGRARKGPAPLNLEIPAYDFPEDGQVVIG